MNTTGERIRNLRISRGETQKDLGDAINVSAMAVSKYENGISTPTDDVKVKIARHYRVSIEWLFFWPDK